MGVTTPNPKAQQELIENAIRNSGVSTRTITYIETHGTGTAIGDPIELKGITKALGLQEKQFCGVGSVKTNIGHLLSAAGIAGVIKVLLSITAKHLPPTINCSNLNPRFDFKNSSVYPVTTLQKWEGYQGILRAGVSAFGLGGSNAHIIISNENVPEIQQVKLPLTIPTIQFKKLKYWPTEDEHNLEEEFESIEQEDFFEFTEIT